MYVVIKNIFDKILAVILIIICSPILICLSIIIKLTSSGPVFFVQRRITKDEKEFEIYKFRTMKTNTPKDVATHLLQNADSYTTSIGKFMRKTSLDELPQLFNIVKGQMSFIGPRPALYNQSDLLKLRKDGGADKVLTGITGLAQVMGRDELSVKDKSDYDNQYANNISFMLDVKISFLTIKNVILQKNII